MAEEQEELNTEKMLEEALAKPKRAVVDDQTFEQHSLSEQIAAAKYLDSKKAMRRSSLGLRIGKLQAGGAQ